jgi:hypothetical protein
LEWVQDIPGTIIIIHILTSKKYEKWHDNGSVGFAHLRRSAT